MKVSARTCLVALLLVALHVAAPSGRQDASSPNYVIGPRDRLRVTVWNQPDISGEYAVAQDGTFTFPLIGQVTAAGLTLAQFETDLKARLANGFYRNPQVTIGIVEYRSQRVFVIGELRTPGAYPLTGEMTLIEVLASAGSTTATAADHAFIIRSPDAEGPVLPGQPGAAAVIRVDLRQLGSAGLAAAPEQLHDGDTVYVPRAGSIFVFGHVRSPGTYPIGQGTTVLQALSLAGGVTEFGATGRVRIIRSEAGDEREMRVKLSDPVRPGDTVVVPERFF